MYDYKQDNLTLTELYVRDATDSLYMIYKDKYSWEELNKFVSSQVNENYIPAIADTRVIYRYENDKKDINNVLKDVYNRNSIICSNGALTEDPEVDEAPTSTMLLEYIAKRKVEKNLAIKLESEGKLEEAKYRDSYSNILKIWTNSGYGIQLMRGSFLYNVDSASAITSQARELISEMMWSVEKFLVSNMTFSTLNELILYIKCTISSDFNSSLMSFIDFIPDNKDLMDRFLFMVKDIPNYNTFIIKHLKDFELMFINMNEQERILFFYKNNFLDFILKNPKVQDLFRFILENNAQFLDPYKIPDDFAEQFATIIELMDNFVINPLATFDRVNKYLTRKRRAILISDTDSIMPNLNRQFKLFESLFTNIDFEDENVMFKTVNLLTNLCTRVCDVHCNEFCRVANVPEKYISRINMKNEFYFRRLIMYSEQKKNYSARKMMREGQLIPENAQIANTGRALRSSSLNPYVTNRINSILENKILKAKDINRVDILMEISALEEEIRRGVLYGDKTFGIIKKFAGEKSYKNIETTNIARMSVTWNRLFPLEPIGPGDSFFAFKTCIERPEDVQKISDPLIREMVLDLIFDVNKKHVHEFKGQDFSRFGLKEIGIPRNGQPAKIPEWLIPIINIDDLINLHTQPIVSLLPSIGIKRAKVNSTKFIKSSMLNIS